MGFAAGDTNLYRFVSNRPTSFTDPSGLFEEPGQFPRAPTGDDLKTDLRLFPQLDPKKVRIIGPRDPKLNCIGHACGLTTGWIDRSTAPKDSKIKLPTAPAMTLEYVEAVFAHYGFTKSKNCDAEKGKIKIAIYGTERKMAVGGATYYIYHAARSIDGGKWTSKLGVGLLIEHDDLSALENGPDTHYFGKVVGCYEKVFPEVAPPPRVKMPSRPEVKCGGE